MDLPIGARIGTGSPRRKAQILALRPDLEVTSIRGNVETRLQKLESPNYGAVVLAAAGLLRLDRSSSITEILPPEVMLPAAGQGALAVEIRADDEETRAVVATANHPASWAAATAERGCMARLGAGCHVPAAAYASADESELWLRGLVSSHDGRMMVRSGARGTLDEAERLGTRVAEDLLQRGARELLKDGSETQDAGRRL